MLADYDRMRFRRFVQDVLGCRCPDAVFERIDVAMDRTGALLQLAVGGRLLIRVHDAGTAGTMLRDMRRWVAAGVAEREALGLKRLRLVLVADNPEAAEAPALGLFGIAAAGLEDVHVHVCRPADLVSALGDRWSAPVPAPIERRMLP